MADGVAVLQPDGSNVRGVVRFIDEMGGLRITYRVTGLTDGEHGFHIHEYGDLTDGCKSACAHFNPDGMTHGGLDTAVRHFGDLGNITSSKGVAEGELFLANGRLDTSRYGILGRMIIVHADRDDLGMGGDEESLKTGNAGKRLACGVIGLADPDTDTMTMDAESTSLATLGVGVAAAGLGFLAGRRDSRTLEAPYQPDQEISDYTPRDLATSSAITGDFTTDSLKYGFGPTSLSAEDDLPDWVDHFTTGTNINPHDDPAYDQPYGQCESTFPDGSHCPNPARTGPFHYSQGYIGKVTACRECWDQILEDIEESVRQGIDGFGDDSVGEITSTGDYTFDDDFQDEFAAEDNYEATYGKEQAKIRRRLKNKLMGEATMGTKAGQWSARKSQELKRRYEAACERKGLKPYKGSKTSKQKDLSNWSKQGWRTASGRKSSVTGEPYFPAKAVKALKDKELYAKAKRQKAAATRAGKQRATYSKDIQAVVARYRAEDDTIDDLGSDQLINRMDAIGLLMDEIVRKHGGSYEKAERDPTYLRLASQHNALARAYARREGFDGFSAESDDSPPSTTVYVGPFNHLSFADFIGSDHFILIESQPLTEYEGGEHEMTDRERRHFKDQLWDMIDALGYEFDYAAQQRSLNDQGAGLYVLRTPSGQTIDYYYNTVYPLAEGQEIPRLKRSLSEADGLIVSGFHPRIELLEDMPNLDRVYLYEGTSFSKRKRDTLDESGNPTVTTGFLDRDDLRFTVMGLEYDYDSGDIKDQYMEQGDLFDGITLDYVDAVEELERRYWGAEDLTITEPPMDIAEEAQARLEAIRQLQWGIRVIERMLREGNIDDAREFARITVEAMRQEEDAARDLGLDPDRFSAESDDEFEYPHHDPDWLYEHHIVQGLSARKIAEMLDVPVNLITRRIHDFGLYVPGEYTADRRLTENELRRMRERRAEDDPVSRIAAGTNDALADFANAHDTDDGFYFAGGLIGGLLIAVAGNIISDRLQDWWRSRSA